MFKVGLTGGIGTGKSYIGKLFSVYGVKIIDSDVIAFLPTRLSLPHSTRSPIRPFTSSSMSTAT